MNTYHCVRVAGIWLLLGSMAVASDADPTLLPPADRTLPDWDAYTSLGVRTAPSGLYYEDPATGTKVFKLTSAETPVRNVLAFHDYSEGGPLISAEWGDGMHTIVLRVLDERLRYSTWIVDYKRGEAVIKAHNWRELPVPMPDVTMTFSNRPGYEHILFGVYGNRLYRFNTATMLLEGETNIPEDGRVVASPNASLNWLQSSRNDEWFVFQSRNEGRVFAFNRLTNDLREAGFKDLDEPALDRDGRYILIRDGGGGDVSCPQLRYGFEDVWHLWNLSDNSITCRGGPVDGPIYAAHTGWGRGLFPSQDVGSSTAPNFYFDPVLFGTPTITAYYADTNYFQATHHALQWIQDVTDETQWYYGSNYNEGTVAATGWSPVSGQIFRTGIDWTPQYQKPVIGVRAVYQVDAGNPDLLRHTLTEVNSLNELREGTFFYDTTAAQLYVWIHGGGNPHARTVLAAPTPVHNGIGARRLDGSDVRLIAHHYSWPGGPDAYRQSPFATTSPDGKLIMFTSNMGLKNATMGGRVDVFLAEIPVTPAEDSTQ